MSNDTKQFPLWAEAFDSSIKFVPLGRLVRIRNQKNDPIIQTQILSLTADRGVILYEEKGAIGNNASEDISRYSIVRKGDIVINSMNVIIGSVGLSKYDGVLSPVYYVLTPINSDLIDMRYLAYHFQIRSFQKSLIRIGYGILDHRMRIPWINLSAELIAVPAISVQRKIVAYLDSQISRLEDLIVLKQSLISKYDELLASRCHSLITGKMQAKKVSTNIEWLPLVPAHWLKLPLRALFSWNKGKDPARLDAVYCGAHPGVFPVYSGQTSNEGVFGEIDTFDFNFDSECALISTVGALAGSMRVVSGKFSLSQNCAILIPKSDLANTRYLNYLWPTIWSVLKSKIPSDMQPSVRLSDLGEVWLYLPPAEEQQEIVQALDEYQNLISEITAETQSSIEKIKELKDSIITNSIAGENANLFGKVVA
jgi:type I restriction enzyme S subunit